MRLLFLVTLLFVQLPFALAQTTAQSTKDARTVERLAGNAYAKGNYPCVVKLLIQCTIGSAACVAT